MIGGAAATATYAGLEADAVTGGTSSSAVVGAEHAPLPPHAGTGGATVSQTSASTGHKGGGPPAEQSSAQEPTETVPTNAHQPVSPVP